jgi:hypothetical protein
MPSENAVVTFNVAHIIRNTPVAVKPQRGRTLLKGVDRTRVLSPIPELQLLKKKLQLYR